MDVHSRLSDRPINRGFTLVELMVVVAVISILAAIAYPSFQSSQLNSNLTSQSNRILGALQFARSEAAARNSNIVVCGSDDQSTCAANSTWSNGFIVLQINEDGNNVLQVFEGLEGNELQGAPVISFSDEGTSTSVLLSLCDDRGNSDARSIRINGSGQASIGRNPACI